MFLRLKTSVLGALGSLLTVFLMYHILKLSATEQSYTRYLDSTEITNYTLLESLLSSGGSPEMELTPNSMSDIHLTLEELKHLALLSSSNTHTQFKTSIIIQYQSIESLRLQLDAISNQKNFNRPNLIHIVCHTEKDKSIIQDAINREGASLYDVTVNKDTTNWFSRVKEDGSSDYVIILNKQVIPGQGYFDFTLRLLNTQQFDHALIGTEQQNINICQQNEAHYVQSIDDIWILRREWYSTLFQHPQASISQALNNMPSIVLPTSLIDTELHGNTKASCVNVSSGGMVFFKDEQSDLLDDLICNFGEKQHRDVIHLVTFGLVDDFVVPSCHDDVVIIHHPVIDIKELDRVINKVSPRVVIYEKTKTADSIIQQQQESTATLIGLPTEDVPLVSSWIADLSVEALAEWHTPQINLIIATGGKRSQKVKNIFSSIKNAHYLGDKVDLSIVMDEKSDGLTSKFVNGLPWTMGVKNIRHRISGVHPMQIFAEAWYPSNDHEYAVMLDDRIELSNSFYIWLKYNLLKYRYSMEQQQQTMIFGISLYSPRIVDTDPSGRQLLYPTVKHSPYLMQAPCSFGGALYFPEHWREFHDYITARLTDQATVKRGSGNPHLFKDSLLSISKSNKWLSSWRKYFDEMIYMRGYVMLYPAFDTSYSTMITITTSSISNKKKKELYLAAEKLYKVPITMVMRELPDLELLPVLDLHGKLVPNHSVLIERGLQLQRKFSACEPNPHHQNDPSDMLCPFNQLIKVPIEQTQVPTKTITLYV